MIFHNHSPHLLSLILCVGMLTNCSDDDDSYRNPQVNITNTPIYNTHNIPVAEIVVPQVYTYNEGQTKTYNENMAVANDTLPVAERVKPKEDNEKKSPHGVDYGAQSYFAGNYTADYTDDYWDYSDVES